MSPSCAAVFAGRDESQGEFRFGIWRKATKDTDSTGLWTRRNRLCKRKYGWCKHLQCMLMCPTAETSNATQVREEEEGCRVRIYIYIAREREGRRAREREREREGERERERDRKRDRALSEHVCLIG